MNIVKGLAEAIKAVRLKKGLTQEFFSDVSSRTYISVLENGKKSPSVEKVGQIAEAMGVHPLTVLTLAYLKAGNKDLQQLNTLVSKETEEFMSK